MIKHSCSLLMLFILFTCCSKSAGVGGNSSIKGKVIVNNINVLGDTLNVYEAQDHEIFIIYGNSNNTHDDKIETSYDGSFEFQYLNIGEYTLYTYSDCLNCPKGQDSVLSFTISIEERKEEIEIDDINIANFI